MIWLLGFPSTLGAILFLHGAASYIFYTQQT
nr:MAG TPA: hypothetical protein [Caudoviricetes sp.]DAN21482.1 MAG TPA_asm: hypothetical protein [Bacteriophage sp.]